MTEPDKGSVPPLLASWKRIYALVLGELVLCILLFRLFSWAFS
jgi:hypothetical protein